LPAGIQHRGGSGQNALFGLRKTVLHFDRRRADPVLPVRHARGHRAVADADQLVRLLAAAGEIDHARMDVPPVDDQLHRDPVVGQCDARKPHFTLVQRRHAVEQVRAVARSGVDGPHGLLLIRDAVAHRRFHAAADQELDQLCRLFQFGR